MKNGKKYIIKFSKQAEKDKINLKNSGLDKNCKKILILMTDDPFCYPPSYEKLSGDLNGLYSRRINRQHRIVYEVDEKNNEIHILRMWTHYDKL
ncbi:MAG: Txe/YoeB family addiction module toxin [Bacilli bacterium]|nr:Txe/YoeB family addiction module toxin [Bacilli bacterium]